MAKKIIAAIFLLSLLTVAVVQAMDKKPESPVNSSAATSSQSNGIQIGDKAPDFQLKTLTGETVKLSSLKGKKVMLNFWATWCPPCKAEMPVMEQFYKQANKKDLVILAVNIDTQNDVKGFAKKDGITFPILLDTDNTVNTTYGIMSIPTTYFIDRNGVIQNKYTGEMTKDIMQQFTDALK